MEGGVCNFAATYDDSKPVFNCGPECGSSFKFVRTWTVLNWCTRTTRKFSQLIKVTDSIAPTITVATPEKVYSVSAWTCTANIDMPKATVKDNCDDHANVVAIDGPVGVTVRKINGIWRAYDVPKGVHEFIYTATDCCGNIGTAKIIITVVDKIAPVASAKEYITVSLTRTEVDGESGVAKVTPEMINNASYDNCTDVYLEVRRDDESPACLNEGDLWDHDNNASTPMVRWNNNVTYNGLINGRDEANPIHEHDRIYDTDKGQYVKVCCEDIGKEVKVWLRVWDDADMDGVFGSADDNYNETWSIIKVENKYTPIIVCEKDITTYCDRSDLKLSLEGWNDVAGNVPATYIPWIDGLCDDYELEYKDAGTITTCNTTAPGRPLTRTYRIKGTDVTCTVNVYILDVETSPKLDWPIALHTWTKCTLTEEDVLNNTIKAVGLSNVFMNGNGGPAKIELPEFYSYVPYYWKEWLGTDYNTPNLGLYCFDSGTNEIATTGTNGLTPVGGGLTTNLEGKTRFDPNWRDVGCRVFGRKIIIDEYNVGEGCKKWIVRFEYLDWCNPEWAACVSTIYKYEDKTPPTIEVAMTDTISIDANCVASWMTSPKGIDDGGCEAGYYWVVTIQTGGAGLVQASSGSNPKFTFNNVPVGKWTVHYKLTDGCGNVTEKDAILVVLGKAPTPYCISLSSAVMKNGTVELWARDFDKNSFDNCIDGPLYFTFDNQHPVLSKLAQVHFFKGAGQNATEAEYLTGAAQKWLPDTKEVIWPNGDVKIEVTGGSSGRLFGCKVGDGSTFPIAKVKMTVWDKNLLSDFCEVTLTLIDNQGACGPTSQVVIGGNVSTEAGTGLAKAEMILESVLPEYPRKTTTNEAGMYTFGAVPIGIDYTVKAYLNENYKNGVNTLDLVHIQRHILALKKLTSPYKMIAADASGDAAVRVEDLVALRKLILGVTVDIPGNTSWRFVDASQEMGETPWPFNEVMSHASIKEGSVDNFIAVKIGDVDGSAKTGLKGENEVTPRNSGVTLSTEDRMVKKGEVVEVQLSADQFTEIYGFQMAMKLKGLTLVNAEGRGIEIGDDNYATPISNVMTMSWSSANAKSVSEGSTVMTMRFKATQDGRLSQMMELSNEVLRSEAYVGSDMETSAVVLEIRSGVRPYVFHLSQNEPNPWRGETVVSYELPKAGKVTLTVLDITGKMVAKKTVDGAAGKNTIGLTKAELGGAAGVMIYRLESGSLSLQKRMIAIE
ncbi:MAG: T9SS type A sorting domain-containing protein [Saprospiraceae bacterium]|nr:T9SS type A sorting domain-containing protein [Saprospiraceae bacterium]